MVLAALSDIAAFHEITFDYNDETGQLIKPANCKCGSFFCSSITKQLKGNKAEGFMVSLEIAENAIGIAQNEKAKLLQQLFALNLKLNSNYVEIAYVTPGPFNQGNELYGDITNITIPSRRN